MKAQYWGILILKAGKMEEGESEREEKQQESLEQGPQSTKEIQGQRSRNREKRPSLNPNQMTFSKLHYCSILYPTTLTPTLALSYILLSLPPLIVPPILSPQLKSLQQGKKTSYHKSKDIVISYMCNYFQEVK